MNYEDVKKFIEEAIEKKKGVIIEKTGKPKSYGLDRYEVKSIEFHNSSISFMYDGEKSIIDTSTIKDLEFD